MWDLVPRPGIEPSSPALGAPSLSHWTTKEVPKIHISCYVNRLSALLTHLLHSHLLHAAPVPLAGLLCSSRVPRYPCFGHLLVPFFSALTALFPDASITCPAHCSELSFYITSLERTSPLSPNPSRPYSVAVLFSSEYLSLSETSSYLLDNMYGQWPCPSHSLPESQHWE